MEESDVLTAKEAAEYLRVSMFTLKKMDEQLKPARIPGGRKYRLRWLNQYLENSKKGKRP